MKRTLLVTAVAIAVSLMMSAPAAHADAFTFVADLTQALEVPATGSSATGFATVALDTVANTMHVDVTFSGLSSGTMASHIHCCLVSSLLTGVNVGVATTLPTFTDFPMGVTSGSYDHVFDLTLASSYNPAFDGATVASQEATLIAGSSRRDLSEHPHHELHRWRNPGLPGADAGALHITVARYGPNRLAVPDKKEPRSKSLTRPCASSRLRFVPPRLRQRSQAPSEANVIAVPVQGIDAGADGFSEWSRPSRAIGTCRQRANGNKVTEQIFAVIERFPLALAIS